MSPGARSYSEGLAESVVGYKAIKQQVMVGASCRGIQAQHTKSRRACMASCASGRRSRRGTGCPYHQTTRAGCWRPVSRPVEPEPAADPIVGIAAPAPSENVPQAAPRAPTTAAAGTGSETFCQPTTAEKAPPQDSAPPQEPQPPVPVGGTARCADHTHSEDKIIAGVASVLTHMASMATAPERLTCFHSKFAPGMHIHDYITRIHKYSMCGSECVVLALLYIDRLLKQRPHMTVSRLSCHRLAFTSIVIAAKFHNDVYYSNKFYAKVGGVQLKELNALERNFLQLIDWKLQVEPQEYELYLNILHTAAAGVFQG